MCFASILAMTVLLLRIFSLSIGENAGVANQVISRRMNRVVVSRSKGLIYDRNLLPVAGMQPCKYVVVIPRGFDRKNVGRLAECCGESNEKILNKLKKDKIFVFEAETIPTKMEGVLVIDGYKRYSGIAQHLIGYLDEEGVVGLSGIEKEYNDFLSLFSSSNTIRYSYDAVQGAIGGLGIGLDQEPISKNGVVLTLDSLLCEEIDKIIEDEIGIVFTKVLEDAGVFKRNEKGINAFKKFINTL
jgi:cell division protein FtsI/penicillin-binding protein 2